MKDQESHTDQKRRTLLTFSVLHVSAVRTEIPQEIQGKCTLDTYFPHDNPRVVHVCWCVCVFLEGVRGGGVVLVCEVCEVCVCVCWCVCVGGLIQNRNLSRIKDEKT